MSNIWSVRYALKRYTLTFLWADILFRFQQHIDELALVSLNQVWDLDLFRDCHLTILRGFAAKKKYLVKNAFVK